MSVTIVEIAKKLNLSPSTVSRVLNNSSLIGEETSQKIHEAAKDMGYVQRVIKRHQTRAILTIKLVVSPKNDNNLPLFYDLSDLVKGIKAGVDFAKLNLAIEINDQHLNLFETKKSSHIDGVIFAFTKPELSVYDELDNRKIPHLTLNRELKNKDYIASNNEDGMHELLSRVYSKKSHFKAAFITTDIKNEIPTARANGLIKYCNDNKIPFSPETDIYSIISTDEINEKFFAILKNNNYDALVCMNDVIAFAILVRAQFFGISIPKQFSLTGFDNSPVQNLSPQKIDTICLPIMEFGQKAGQWINERIITKSKEPFQFKLTGQYKAGETI